MKPIIFIIIIQLVIIIFLGSQISKKNKTKITFTPIERHTVDVKNIQTLNFFYEPKPNITQIVKPEWLDKKVRYSFNKDGLNERYDYSVEKQKSTYRIITLGDSFTFGEYNNTQDNWTELLEDRLKKLQCRKYDEFEVINLGVYGYDIQYEVQRYIMKGQKYNPDLIVWMLVDPRRVNELSGKSYYDCMKINPSPSLKKQSGHYCFRTALDELENKKGINTIYKILEQEFELIFDYYDKDIIVIDLNNTHREIIENVKKVSQLNVFNYDFINEKLRLPDGHPNEKGHQKIAEDVFDYLMKNKIIPCD